MMTGLVTPVVPTGKIWDSWGKWLLPMILGIGSVVLLLLGAYNFIKSFVGSFDGKQLAWGAVQLLISFFLGILTYNSFKNIRDDTAKGVPTR